MAFSYPVEFFTTAGDEPTEMAAVDLGPDGGRVVLTKTDHDRIVREAQTERAYVRAVQAAKLARAQEWRRERGPESELGRGMEAGGPHPTEHGE